MLLALARIAQRVGDHPATLAHIVLRAVQVAVKPQPGRRQQVVERIAKAGGAGRESVARVGAEQAGRKVGDHHGGAVKGLGQRAAQPGLALQAQRAQLGRQQRLTAVQRVVLAQVKIGRPKRLLPPQPSPAVP